MTFPKLTIGSGPNQGAELELREPTYLIGSDESACDIVLADDAVLPQHATLRFDPTQGLTIEVLDGAIVLIGERSLGAGVHPVPEGNPITLGSSVISVSGVQVVTAVEEDTSSLAEPEADAANALRRPRAGLLSYGLVACCVLALVSVLVVLLTGTSLGAGKEDELTATSTALSALGYKGLRVSRDSENYVVVSGYISSDADREKIHEALVNVGRKNTRLLLAVGGAVREFESKAIAPSAPMERLGPGHLLLEKTDRSKIAISPKPEDRETPDFKVRAVQAHDGQPAYLESVDGQHYLPGAILPGGFTLASLTPSGVMLTRDGKKFLYGIPSEEKIPERELSDARPVAR